MRAAFILPLVLASIAFAQAPQLLVQNPDNPAEKPHPIALSKADVHLLIAGRLCQTTMTLTFSNAADRVLEGELVFPLPENATVCGYALDVNGQLVDAVTIEKEKARVVFETETRRGIDPGIVEQMQGNNFRTRVHPIPAKGSRTIRVQYVSEPSSHAELLMYKLPVAWPGSTPELTVRIESFSTQPPKVEALEGLSFESDGAHHMAQRRLEKATLAKDVMATLPASAVPATIIEKRSQSTVSVENLDPKAAEQFVKTDHYFVLNDSPTPTPQTTTATRAKPRRIAIAWDASLSRANVDHSKEMEFISKHLAALGNVNIEIIAFRNVPDAPKTFAVKNGDSSELRDYLGKVVYDGGTNLSAVEFRKQMRIADEALPAIDYYLLFTDGLSNLGPEMPATTECPIYAVAVDPRSNHSLLKRLCGSSGGQYLNLDTLSIENALAALTDSPFTLISIDCDAKEIADVYPRLPQPVQGRVTVAGRLLAKSAKLTLNYGRGGAITLRVPITLMQDGAVSTSVVSRFWAQLKLADLSAALDRNEAEITALGKQFNLVTPFTSMIVLENVEQYLRYKIVPPKTRGDVYAQFMQQIEQQRTVGQQEEKAKIDRVVAMWNGRLAWWNQEFKYAADFQYKELEKPKEAFLGVAGRVTSDAPIVLSPSPAPGAAPSTPAQQSGPAEAITGRAVEVRVDRAAARQPEAALRRRGAVAVENLNIDGAAQFIDGFESDTTLRGKFKAQRGFEGNVATFDPGIALKSWSPDTPYLKALQSAPAAEAYNVYLQQRKSYESSPAFYLDCADFFGKSSPDIAFRILSNIPELALDDGRLLRIAAHRLQQVKELDLAIDLFEKITRLRPEEPQSFRDLALALADRAEGFVANKNLDRARSDYERSLQLLHKVVMNHWDRFEEIEVIALTEANRILATLSSQDSALRTVSNPFDPRLIKLLDPDLRIVMTWDTDNTDIDLHVTEPSGETCVYNHNRTTIGGALSKDFTQGYGPEEYMLKKLMPGEYKIQAHFYGNRDQKLVGPTTVQATVITHYGRPDEKRQSLTLRLKDAKEMVDIGTVTLK